MKRDSFIEARDDLARFIENLRGARVVALDTEFIRERSYVPKVELVQIAAPDGQVALVDYGRLGTESGDPLGALLSDRSVLKVFHAAEQDLEMLALLFGEPPGPLWDTQLAAGLFGYSGRLGYAAVVESLLGSRPAGGEAYTDWSRRPLSPEQLRYAAEDVRHLIPLYEAERAKLAALGRLGWVEEECEALRARVSVRRDVSEPERHERIRGWRQLDRRGLAILRELAAWREREAARRNRPAGSILRDHVLVEIARRAPSRPEDLRALRGGARRDLDRHAEAIVAAVETGRRLPPAKRPSAPPAGLDLDRSQAALVPLLQAALQAIAAEKQVSPNLLASAADVERLVAALTRRESVDDVRLLRGWRGELVGREMRALVEGRLTVSWDPAARAVRLADRG